MFVGFTVGSVKMLQNPPVLAKYDAYNTDDHVFGRTLLRSEIKPL